MKNIEYKKWSKKIIRRLLRDFVYVRGGHFVKGFTRNLTKEKCFIERLPLQGKTVYDIGACHGIFTYFFSRSVGKSGQVISFEPVAENYQIILKDLKELKLKNVKVINSGLGKQNEKKKIAIRSNETATASMQEDIFLQIMNEEHSRVFELEIFTLDHQIQSKSLPKPHLIKIDVEGLEFEVLQGMVETIENYKPSLLIEIHGVTDQKKINNIKDVTNFLINCNYTIEHVERSLTINRLNSELAKEGHIYCVYR